MWKIGQFFFFVCVFVAYLYKVVLSISKYMFANEVMFWYWIIWNVCK